jgi:hypothetical protein
MFRNEAINVKNLKQLVSTAITNVCYLCVMKN